MAEELGWQVVNVDAAQGIVEATDTSFWFGFVDDIVVRVTPVDAGARVDVRSVSRVGLSDIGKVALTRRDPERWAISACPTGEIAL